MSRDGDLSWLGRYGYIVEPSADLLIGHLKKGEGGVGKMHGILNADLTVNKLYTGTMFNTITC